jgi:hypothetical protein
MIHTERLTDLQYMYLAQDLVCDRMVATLAATGTQSGRGVSGMTRRQCAARMAAAPITLSAAVQLEHWAVRRMHRGGIAAHVSGMFPTDASFQAAFNVTAPALDDMFVSRLERA